MKLWNENDRIFQIRALVTLKKGEGRSLKAGSLDL